MQAAWGSTRLPVNGAEVTSRLRVVQQTDWGAPLRYGVEYDVVVTLVGTGQADLSLQESALRAALSVRNQDFVLYTDAGGVSSAAILAAQTASGTRVVSVWNPEAQGAEFVNRRTVGFTVAAEYHVANTANAVVSWRETLSITGNGGPRRVWRFPLNAPPIRQEVTPFSLVRAVQQGRAIGYLRQPLRPAPIFPGYKVNELESGTQDSPEYLAPGAYANYAVSWGYVFERGDGPLVGAPNLPPGVI